MIKRTFIALFALTISVAAHAEKSNEIPNQVPSASEKKEFVMESPPITLIDYQTMKKELVLKPDSLTPEEAMRFIPPLPESPVIFNLYIEEGFSIMDAIQYTHQDILDLYKEHLKETKVKIN